MSRKDDEGKQSASAGAGSQSSSGKTEGSGKIDKPPSTDKTGISATQYKVPPPNSNLPIAAWRSMDEAARAAEWRAYQERAARPEPGRGTKPRLDVPPPDSDIPLTRWRAMDESERRAAWGAPPPGIAVARDKWQQMPADERAAIRASQDKRQRAEGPEPGQGTKANLDVPPPDSGIAMAEWRAMDDGERQEAWDLHRRPAKRGSLGRSNHFEVPPPGSDISMAEWRAMSEVERRAAWNAHERDRKGRPNPGSPPGQPEGNQIDLSVPPPGSGITLRDWRAMDLEHRADLWALHHRRLEQGVQPGERVLNQRLLDFLDANRDPATGEWLFVTVQDLINHFGSGNAFNAKCREYGLDPVILNRYRAFPLRSLAVASPPGRSGAPRSTIEANVYFITQYDTSYNPGSPNKNSSNNCGPASLAMVLRTLGKMPPELVGQSPEDQIDYVRALMYPNDPRIKDRTLPNGTVIRVLDDDGKNTGFGAEEYGYGAEHAARVAGLTDATKETGWDNFAVAVVTNHQPVVLAGVITPEWRALLAKAGNSTYGSVSSPSVEHFIAVLGTTPEGGFIVADPMFAGGTVVLTLDQLGTFASSGNPEFLTPVPSTPPSP